VAASGLQERQLRSPSDAVPNNEEPDPLSRVRIFALVASLAALSIAFAACGSGGGGGEDPQSVIEDATLQGVESGNLDLKLDVKSEGKKGGNLSVSLSGPFQAGGKESLPQLAMTAKANGSAEGKPVDFEGGLTLLSDRAFVEYKGTEYEVDPTTFGFVKSGFEQAQQQGGEEGSEITACQEAATGLKVGDFVDNLKNEGSADVEGTSTTKVSGDLNSGSAVDAIIKLTENPACSAQLEAAGPLPLSELKSAKGELSKAIKKAHADVYVGDDNIIRKVATQLSVEMEGETVEIALELSLGEVNEEQEISAPANAQPLEGLFQKLGINPIELLEGLNGGEEGLGNLLEGLTGGGGQTSEGAGIEGAPSGGSGGQQAYLECLQGIETPTDLQKCANLVQ
jgi:hypothetical protein